MVKENINYALTTSDGYVHYANKMAINNVSVNFIKN